MSSRVLIVVALGAFALGCNKSPEGGTPGTDSSFSITAPTVPTTVKQDNKESVKLSLKRGSEFKKDVKLSATSNDPKVKVELSKSEIKASDASPAEFTVTVTPSKEAAVAEHKVKVTGTPEGGGNPTSVEFVVNVAENK